MFYRPARPAPVSNASRSIYGPRDREHLSLPEMATGTVMWNVRGGLYVDVDLYASSAAAGGERNGPA